MTAINSTFAEMVKPVPVRVGSGRAGRFAFAVRRSVDLQLSTIWRFLAPELSKCRGDFLDVGCGDMPFRRLLPKGVRYNAIDVPQADGFGMARDTVITMFDGQHVPFADQSFDHLLCTEVLEHAEDPVALIGEMHRVLRPGGTLLVTIPFSARVHHAPYGFHRFTRFQVARLFAGFMTTRIEERGNDLSVIANKLIVVVMRMLRPSISLIWKLPVLVVLGPIAAAFLLVAHLSLHLGWGSTDDPLGYAVVATR